MSFLHSHHTSSNGYRYHSHEQLNQVINIKPNLDRIVIGYCPVSSNKQKTKLFQYANTARFAYNWALGREQENYKNGGKFISDGDLRKEFTQLKKTDEYVRMIILIRTFINQKQLRN